MFAALYSESSNLLCEEFLQFTRKSDFKVLNK